MLCNTAANLFAVFPCRSYDVALWAAIADFPYTWPLWQRYSSKFVVTNLVSATRLLQNCPQSSVTALFLYACRALVLGCSIQLEPVTPRLCSAPHWNARYCRELEFGVNGFLVSDKKPSAKRGSVVCTAKTWRKNPADVDEGTGALDPTRDKFQGRKWSDGEGCYSVVPGRTLRVDLQHVDFRADLYNTDETHNTAAQWGTGL